MDIYAVILFTSPIFFPLVTSLGYDSIMLGVLIVLNYHDRLCTPPDGVLVFAIKGMVRDVPLTTIFRGTVFFILAKVVCVALLVTIPQISLLLPNLMIPHG
jgi:C4-dicarboxylate transporter DctM subunit